MRIIRNCLITNSDTKLIKEYGQQDDEFHTGVDIEANEIFSLSSGVVVHVGKNESEENVVIVSYNKYICVSYGHLQSVDVLFGDPIILGQKIGQANKFVHIELLNINQQYSTFPVRIGESTFYKFDPTDIVDGTFKFPVEEVDSAEIDIDFDTSVEFSMNLEHDYPGPRGSEITEW